MRTVRKLTTTKLFRNDHLRVVLGSGAEVAIRLSDLREPRIASLDTTLREFLSGEAQAAGAEAQTAPLPRRRKRKKRERTERDNRERYLAAKERIAQDDAARSRAIDARVAVIGATTAGIKRQCAAEWPTDFRMQAYCIDQQEAAVNQLVARPMDAGDRRTIRTHCAAEWSDDFRMRDSCEQQQLEAL